MSDPYNVLGVSRDASDETIKAAYRQLAKKYHPDRNPGDDLAAKKMNEVNAAYDAIKDAEARSRYGSGDAYGGYGAYGSAWQSAYGGSWSAGAAQSERTEIRAAENYIRSNHFREALNALSGVEQGGRTARWHYLYSIANAGLGNKIAALEHARIAVNMEPGSQEYASLLNQLEYGGNVYTSYSASYPRSATLTPDKFCLGLCAAQFCMRMFCGC